MFEVAGEVEGIWLWEVEEHTGVEEVDKNSRTRCYRMLWP
jgi:hypothetical protein